MVARVSRRLRPMKIRNLDGVNSGRNHVHYFVHLVRCHLEAEESVRIQDSHVYSEGQRGSSPR